MPTSSRVRSGDGTARDALLHQAVDYFLQLRSQQGPKVLIGLPQLLVWLRILAATNVTTINETGAEDTLLKKSLLEKLDQ